MFKTKKLSTISIANLMLLSTLFSCSFTDREKVDFVKEEKIHELTGAKSRCIPFEEEQEHIADTCICCGKKAETMVIWDIQY